MYNTGQSAVVVKDLAGKEYPAIAAVNRKRRVNGQREISLSFLYTEINKDFINEMDFHWKILFGGEWYTVINPGKQTEGDYLQVNVTAVLSFFVTLNGYYLQDKVENKSMTPANFFRELFNGTPYNFVLVDVLTANTLSYGDNQSKTERFLYAIERFNAEYIVRGNTVYIHTLIGSDKDVILHEDLNVNSVSINVDASGFHTWARGYGDLPENPAEGEEEKYRLEITYRSPLANKFGEIEGPAIKDGNYKIAANLTDAVKNQVENSYTISTEVDVVDLSNNGYPEMVLEEGDRVWLVVSKLNLNQQVRVVEIDETFDWEGNLINAKYTVGNEGIAARYKADQYNTLKDFKDILTGKKKIAADWLPDAIKRASDIINGNLDSHFKYGAGEIIGINRNNPNGYMRFNTDGLGFSRDGGKTYRSAITYEGIVADAITVGTLRGILIEGVDIHGSTFLSVLPNDPNTFTRISGAYLLNRGKYQRTWNGVTRTIDSTIQIKDGYLRFADNGDTKALGYSVNGISTYLNGTGENNASGTINFFDTYAYNQPGLGIYSRFGDVSIVTDGSSGRNINIHSKYSTDILAGSSASIASKESFVYLNPKTNQTGQKFRLDITNLDNWGELMYGHESSNFASGFRFKGDRVEIRGQGNEGLGSLLARTIDVSTIKTWDITPADTNLRVGVPNQFQVRNSDFSGWGDAQALDWKTASSITIKTNVKPLTDQGLQIIRDLQPVEYHYIQELEIANYTGTVGFIAEMNPVIANMDCTAISNIKLSTYNTLAIKELDEKVINTENETRNIYDILGVLIDENEALTQRVANLEQTNN